MAATTDAPDATGPVTNDEAREIVNAWLAEHWDPALSVEQWWQLVADAGLTAPHFASDQGGRGWPRKTQATVRNAFAAFGALRPPGGLGLLMAAPTILAQGNADQIERHVRPILDGSLGWCQLFSEPGAGSDLAGITTRAERDGDRWVINGQKVWSSMAAEADYGMLLARTNFDVPKHQGISWFAFPLDQPGVTIRPLREMTGEAVFNEVFLDDAVVDDADLVGGEGNGWAVTQTTLYYERTGIGAGGAHITFPMAGPKGGMVGRTAGDAAGDPLPGGNMNLTFDDLTALAREHGRDRDPHIRQSLATLHTYVKVGAWNALRGRAEAAKGGGQAVAQTGKITQTNIMKLAGEIALDIIGAHGTLATPDGPQDGRFSHALVFSAASSIYGGTDEIQRNIIGERILGLPRELNPDKDLAYGEVLRKVSPAGR